MLTRKVDITLLDYNLFFLHFQNFTGLLAVQFVFYYTPHGKIISCVKSGNLGDHTTEPQ